MDKSNFGDFKSKNHFLDRLFTIIDSKNAKDNELYNHVQAIQPVLLNTDSDSLETLKQLLKDKKETDEIAFDLIKRMRDVTSFPIVDLSDVIMHACRPLLDNEYFDVEPDHRIISMLLQQRNDIFTVSSNSLSYCLELCAESGFLNIVPSLLEHGADIHRKNDYGHTPLMRSIAEEKCKMAELLIKHGADVNKPFVTIYLYYENVFEDKKVEVTPLGYAVSKGHYKMVQLLLKHSANPNLYKEISPLEIAQKMGVQRIAGILKDASTLANEFNLE